MKSREMLALALGVFLTIIAWMILDIYHIQTKINEQITIKPAQVPNYVMDKSIIEVLKQKQK